MLDVQRAAFDRNNKPTGEQGGDAGTAEERVDTDMVDTRPDAPAQFQQDLLPSARISAKIREFEATVDHPDPEQRGFVLVEEQRTMCKWFGSALDIALQEERDQKPMNKRTQRACLLIGAGGTGKTSIILKLLLEVFVEYFPAQDGEDRYIVTTFSHAQGDAISNEKFRAQTAHTATGCRVA